MEHHDERPIVSFFKFPDRDGAGGVVNGDEFLSDDDDFLFTRTQEGQIEDIVYFHLYSKDYKKRVINIASSVALKKMKNLESSVNLLLSRNNGGGRESILELRVLDLLVLAVCLLVGINIGFFFGRLGNN